MRRLIPVLPLLMLTVSPPAPSASAPPPPPATDMLVEARPVTLSRDEPERRSLGALTWLGGWQLVSRDERFGGISAMAVASPYLVLLSDSGVLTGFALDAKGRVVAPVIAPLAATPGGDAARVGRDSESMTIDAESGMRWIGFEQHHEIWRYGPDGQAQASRAPPEMASWPDNGGAEAIIRLADGRFLVFSESADGAGPGTTAVLLFDRDPTEPDARARMMSYRPPEGHRITDAALLPDGSLIAINRRFTLTTGVSVVVTRIRLDVLDEQTVLQGVEIARLAPPLTVDNMEAVAVSREGGRTILWMASDDNFSRLQRTLLFKFAL